MLGIRDYEDVLVQAMHSLNSAEWFGSINGHGKVLHFTMWCLQNNTIKVFHVHMDKVTWKEFTNVCQQFVARHQFALQLIMQDNEQPLLTEISCLPLSHLAVAVDHFLKTATIYDFTNNDDQGYHGLIFENVAGTVPRYTQLTNLLRENIWHFSHRIQLQNNIDLQEIYTIDVENALQNSLAGLTSEGLNVHPMQGEVLALFFRVMRDICNSDGAAARRSINECTGMMNNPANWIIRQYKSIYHSDNITESLQRIGNAIGNAFHANLLLLSFDYHISLGYGVRIGSDISRVTLNHIVTGEKFAAGTFKSVLGNCSLAVEFVQLQLSPSTFAQLLTFVNNLKN